MSVITIFSSTYCYADKVASKVAADLKYNLVTDQDLIKRVSARSSVEEKKLRRAMYGAELTFEQLFKGKKRNLSHIALIRSSLAEVVAEDKTIYHGLGALLLPKNITNLLGVGLFATVEYRAELFMKTDKASLAHAKAVFLKQDENLTNWARYLVDTKPWDKRLYDVLIPMHSTTIEDAASLICRKAVTPAVMETTASRRALDDFLISCRVYEALADEGYDVKVLCDNGEVTLIVDDFVVRLEQFKKKIEKVAAGVLGVVKASSQVGPNFRKSNIYPNLDLAPKILLVDDEKDFVCTLSERLEPRDLEAAIAYDGEQALSIIASDEPDVMVLDIKMPGIDGIEVLRRVKRDHPNIEVIILTGHGSDQERILAVELGAFAYLHKPADIDALAETMRRAYRKAERSKKG